jgi:hypothetical protein
MKKSEKIGRKMKLEKLKVRVKKIKRMENEFG